MLLQAAQRQTRPDLDAVLIPRPPGHSDADAAFPSRGRFWSCPVRYRCRPDLHSKIAGGGAPDGVAVGAGVLPRGIDQRRLVACSGTGLAAPLALPPRLPWAWLARPRLVSSATPSSARISC